MQRIMLQAERISMVRQQLQRRLQASAASRDIPDVIVQQVPDTEAAQFELLFDMANMDRRMVIDRRLRLAEVQ